MNPNVKETCKLKPNEQLRDIFHPGNIRTLTKPTFKSGVAMCLRYHSLGFYFGDCKHVTDHGDMDNKETANFCQFIGTVRGRRTDFQQHRGNNNNNQDRNADMPATSTPPATENNTENQG